VRQSRVQAVPFQCMINGSAASDRVVKWRTAQQPTSVADRVLTPSTRLNVLLAVPPGLGQRIPHPPVPPEDAVAMAVRTRPHILSPNSPVQRLNPA
jgi:hypothetical protein